MPIRDEPWPDGVPCWADLSVLDVPAAQAFYATVLGWQWETTDADPQYGGYTMATVDGQVAAGLGPAQDPSQPNAWTVYVATSDTDSAAERVRSAGGQVVAGPFDVGPMGRMAIAVDPQGSSFGLWQAGQHAGASVYNAPGALVWEDVGMADPDAGRQFYSAVFGWSWQVLDGMGDYQAFTTGGDPLGGAGPVEAVGAAGWQLCFGCTDTDAVVAEATRAGGQLVAGPEDTPYGRFAAMTDPWGARFAVMSL